MFQGLSAAAQVILSIGVVLAGLAVIVTIAIICWKVGIRIGFKRGAYVRIGGDEGGCVNDAKKSHLYWLTTSDLETIFEIFLEGIEDIVALGRLVSVNKKMDFVEDRLVILIGYLESIYLRLSKNRVQAEILTKHVDYRHFVRFANRVIYGDIDREGIKSVIRKYIKSKDYHKEGADFSKFIQDFVALVLQIFRNFLNTDYDNTVVYETNKTRDRVVSEESLYKEIFSDACKVKLVELFSDIFNNAKKVDSTITKQRDAKIQERKRKIHILACNKNNLKTKGGK